METENEKIDHVQFIFFQTYSSTKLRESNNENPTNSPNEPPIDPNIVIPS